MASNKYFQIGITSKIYEVMYLERIIIVNYRSCNNIDIPIYKDEPNIFIGINDSGKTSILKAIGLLLEEKPFYNFIKDNSSKKDFSNSPIDVATFEDILKKHELPNIVYTKNQTIVIGKFTVEAGDIDESNLTNYSDQFLWAVEKATNIIWIARVFESNSSVSTTFLLMQDCDTSDEKLTQFWNLSATDLNKRVKEFKISDEEIKNENKAGRFSNLEKVRAIYAKQTCIAIWRPYKSEKGDKTVFPIFRYLDWNCSLDDIKKTATDAMSVIIASHLTPLRQQANEEATSTESEINDKLQGLLKSINEIVPDITGIKTKVFFEVKEQITDILINKVNGDGDIHVELQGEGVKRQIWFALLRAGALANIESGIKNKKFIWAFDEPETHLYPSKQRDFFEIIKDVCTTNIQSILSTHSTVFIDKSRLKTIRSAHLTEFSYSEILACETVDEIFESLELRNSDFLFFDKFLVTEGDTESYLMPELFKKYTGKSLDEVNVQPINLTGKSKWLDGKKALENVLKGFRKSLVSVYYLFDGDAKFSIGEDAIRTNFFFVGKQDIEDSISNSVWINFVLEATDSEIALTDGEIQTIKDGIVDNVEMQKQEKFYSKLKKLVRQKLSALRGEEVSGSLLPEKGNELAQLLLKHTTSINDFGSEIKSVFDKLEPLKIVAAEVSGVVSEVINENV